MCVTKNKTAKSSFIIFPFIGIVKTFCEKYKGLFLFGVAVAPGFRVAAPTGGGSDKESRGAYAPRP